MATLKSGAHRSQPLPSARAKKSGFSLAPIPRRAHTAFVRYRIEYPSATPSEKSVCHLGGCDASLQSAVLEARAGAGIAESHGADGFQIRDDFQGGSVVTWERFQR